MSILKIDLYKEIPNLNIIKQAKRLPAILEELKVSEDDYKLLLDNFAKFSGSNNSYVAFKNLQEVFGKSNLSLNVGGWFFSGWGFKKNQLNFSLLLCDDLGCSIEFLSKVNKEDLSHCEEIIKTLTKVIGCQKKEDLEKIILDLDLKQSDNKTLII